MLNVFFASIFSGKTACPQDSCPPGMVDGVREQNGPPVIQEAVRELLSVLDIHICGPRWDPPQGDEGAGR